jgi:hypothetical protein
MKFIITQFSPRSVFLPFRSKYPPQHSVLKNPQSVFLSQIRWEIYDVKLWKEVGRQLNLSRCQDQLSVIPPILCRCSRSAVPLQWPWQ